MSDPLDRLDRLGQLRARGDISEAEFEAQKAAILAAGNGDEAPSQATVRAKSRLEPAITIAIVIVLVAGAYLLARLHGTEDALSEASNQATPSAAVVQQTALNPQPAPADGQATPDTVTPPADYLRLCVFSGITPMGTRLGTLSDFAAKLGRTVSWEPEGSDWILRARWHDQLSGTEHEEAFQFARRAGADTATHCDGPLGEVSLDRMVLDSVETKAFDPAFAPAFYKDSSTPNLLDPASSTLAPAQSADTAPALRSGRCRLAVKGMTYIDGACYYSLDKDGSFSIYDTPSGSGGYFAMLERDGLSGTGYWNGSKGSSHAQDELGTMSRTKACWVNGDNQICLWS